jgi:hypothetical protein
MAREVEPEHARPQEKKEERDFVEDHGAARPTLLAAPPWMNPASAIFIESQGNYHGPSAARNVTR